MILQEIASVVIAYLLGSIPFAYVFARLIKGIDIRQVGTHNAGAMNTVKEVGLVPGLAVMALDIAKGSLAILIAQWLDVRLIVVFLAGLAVIAGHTWPVFLGFRGGKGAATTVGVLFALAPNIFVISFVIIVVLVVITRDTGFGISIGLVLFILLLWIFGEDIRLILYSIAFPLFLLLINIPDFRRDISNTRGFKNWMFGDRVAKWKRRTKRK
jgi:acyl phosphate:glycerol-3-phosphate acyltransferase